MGTGVEPNVITFKNIDFVIAGVLPLRGNDIRAAAIDLEAGVVINPGVLSKNRRATVFELGVAALFYKPECNDAAADAEENKTHKAHNNSATPKVKKPIEHIVARFVWVVIHFNALAHAIARGVAAAIGFPFNTLAVNGVENINWRVGGAVVRPVGNKPNDLSLGCLRNV